MTSRHGRKIHPFRTSGVNKPGYSRPTQPTPQSPPQPTSAAGAPPRPTPLPVPRAVPLHPQDAKTVEEGVEGFVRAMSPKLVTPRFISTAGPWVRLGEHQTRVPPDVAIATTKARDGRHIAVIAHLDESDHPGKVQVLVDTVQGVRELVGLAPEHLQELRIEFFGR